MEAFFCCMVPLTVLSLARLFSTMRPSPLSSVLVLGGLLVTCGCGQGADTLGPPLLPTPPPPGCGNTGAGVCYHVDPSGNDANPGTAAQPFRTIQHAADIVNPGDGVLVANGMYTAGGTNVVTISRSGTAANRIVFRAANRWQAVIDGQNNASTTGIAIPGGFVWVGGFEVRNTSRDGIDTDVGHDQGVIGNHVHDIGRACTSGTGDRKSTRLNSSHLVISYAVFCLKKKKKEHTSKLQSLAHIVCRRHTEQQKSTITS